MEDGRADAPRRLGQRLVRVGAGPGQGGKESCKSGDESICVRFEDAQDDGDKGGDDDDVAEGLKNQEAGGEPYLGVESRL